MRTVLAALLVVAALAVPATAAAKTVTVAVGRNYLATKGTNERHPATLRIRSGDTLRFAWVSHRRHSLFQWLRGMGIDPIRFPARKSSGQFAVRLYSRAEYGFTCTLHPKTMWLRVTVR